MNKLGIKLDELYSEALVSGIAQPTPEREKLMLEAIDGALIVVTTMNSADTNPEWQTDNVAQKRAAVADVFEKLLNLRNRDKMDATSLNGVAAVELYFALNPSRRPEEDIFSAHTGVLTDAGKISHSRVVPQTAHHLGVGPSHLHHTFSPLTEIVE